MDKNKVKEMMKTALLSHQQWADHFERFPDIERKYVDTGENGMM
jgi:hypothetical protein